MRWTPILLLPFALAVAPVAGQDGDQQPPPHKGHRGFGKGGHAFLLQKFFGDVTDEQKAALKGLGLEFLAGVQGDVPTMKDAVKTLITDVHAALTPDEQAQVKGVVAKLHSLSIPEKIGLAQGFIGALNTAAMRADVHAFFKGAPEERTKAGDRVALAATRQFVAEVAKRAEIKSDAPEKVVAAVENFLSSTYEPRMRIRAVAQEKIHAAWTLLTPDQKGRIKGAIDFVRGWLKATAQE